MDDVIAEVRNEQARLRRERDAIDARLAELDTVLRVLPTLGTDRPRHHVLVAETGEFRVTGTHASSTVKTIKDRIASSCEKLLLDGKPRHTRELVAHLLGEGIPLNGKDQVLQVSAVLSKDDRFGANRSVGWTLASKKGEGPDAETSGPSDSRQLPLNAAAEQPQP